MASGTDERSTAREGVYLFFVVCSFLAAIAASVVTIFGRGAPGSEGFHVPAILAALLIGVGQLMGTFSLFACYSGWTFIGSVLAIAANAVVFEVF